MQPSARQRFRAIGSTGSIHDELAPSAAHFHTPVRPDDFICWKKKNSSLHNDDWRQVKSTAHTPNPGFNGRLLARANVGHMLFHGSGFDQKPPSFCSLCVVVTKMHPPKKRNTLKNRSWFLFFIDTFSFPSWYVYNAGLSIPWKWSHSNDLPALPSSNEFSFESTISMWYIIRWGNRNLTCCFQ